MSNNQISRRDFVKGLAAGAASIATLGVLQSCEYSTKKGAETAGSTSGSVPSAGGIYIPGTYSATANGMGTVTVTMTFDSESITDVVLDVSGETENIGQAAADTLVSQILEAQGTDIDGVAGATVTATAVKVAADACIAQAKGEGVTLNASSAPKEGASSLDLSFLDKPDPIPEDQISKTIECDVAVVGLGVAGVSAVRAAAEAGLKVICVEKTSGVCGRSSQFSFFNCEKAREMGIEDLNVNELVNEMMIQMAHRADPVILKKWADNCGEAVTWYGEAYDGIQWLHMGEPNPTNENTVFASPMASMPKFTFGVDHEMIFSGTVSFRPNGHLPVLQANFDKAMATGNIEAYFDAPARQLIREEEGR